MLTVFLLIAAFPLILFLPGYLLLDLFVPLSRRDGLSRLFLQVLASSLLASIISLLLADVGRFSLGALTLILFVISGAAGGWRVIRRIPLSSKFSVPPGSALLGLILIGSCFLYGRPHEDIGGGWDPGVCLQTGANIAQTGGINYRDEFFASLPDDEKELFLHTRHRPQRFPGFRVVEMESGLISPQFYHLYSCWLAMAHEVGGPRAMLYVNPFFAVLALLAVYLAATTLFDSRTGLIACLLLAGNMIQIWFARFSTAEILTQYLIWSGLYTFGLHVSERERGVGILCAICFGTAFLVRITTVMLLPALVLVLVYRSLTGEWRRDWPLMGVLAFYFIAALLHNRLVAVAYFDLPGYIAYVVRRYGWLVLPAGCASIAVACSGARGRAFLPRLLRSGWIRTGLSILVVGFAVYAYFIRPGMVARSPLAASLRGDMLRRLLSDSSAFRELAWFFTAPGLWLSVGGCAFMICRGMNTARSLFLLVALTMAWFFFRSKMIEPFYMFTLRRFVPVVVPSLAVFMAFLIARLSFRAGRAGRAVAWIVVGLLVLAPLCKGRHIVRQVDFQGLARTCGRVVRLQELPAGAPVICDGYWLAAPLHYLYGWNTLALSDPTEEKYTRAIKAAERWLSEGRSVYYLTHGDLPFTEELDFVRCGEVSFASDQLEHSIQRYPARQVPRCVRIGLFRVVPGSDASEMPEITEIPVGWNAFGIGPGFRQATKMDERGGCLGETIPRLARQIDGTAEMVIPWDGSRTELVLTVEVRARTSFRPPLMSLKLNEIEMGHIALKDGREEYTIVIPAGENGSPYPGRGRLRFDIHTAAGSAEVRVFLECVRLEPM